VRAGHIDGGDPGEGGRAIGCTFFDTSMMEYCTSAEVNGVPSCHFTSSRKLNVMVRRSAD
jgi:hypothetical protein